ncbi:MAG: YfhO family protein [Elusimicrobia bacterium]|nr:YfhO family protein [Elusimicrobiota bacterium]
MKKRIFLFMILIILFFNGIIFTDKIYFFRDILNLFMPYRLFAAENIQNGILPVWNPYTFFGQPFLANPETSLFYPFTILFYIFKFVAAYKIFVVLHFFLALIFFYLLVRFLKAKNSYAIIASVCWAFGGYFTARVEFISILGAAIWLPVVLMFLVKNKKVLLGLVLSFQLFAGHPQVLFYSVIFLIFFLNKKRIFMLIYSLVFVLLLSAIQLIPFTEYISNSNRSKGLTYEEASSVSVKPYEIFRNLLPQKKIDITGNYWLKSFYVGIIPLILIFLYFLNSDKKLILPFLVIIILALGRNTPVYWLLYKYFMPFSRIRYPAAIMFLFTFVLCLMVSQVNFTNTIKSKMNIIKINKYLVLITIFTLLDLYFNFLKLNPDISSKYMNIKTENMEKLQNISNGKKYLVLSDAYSTNKNYYDFINTLPTNINIPYHIYNASGYDPLTTKGMDEFIEKMEKNLNAEHLARHDIRYVITNRNMGFNWKKITKNLFENKISIAKNKVFIPHTYNPKYIYFLIGLCTTMFSIMILVLNPYFVPEEQKI